MGKIVDLLSRIRQTNPHFHMREIRKPNFSIISLCSYKEEHSTYLSTLRGFYISHTNTLPLPVVGVAVGWFPSEIGVESEAGTRVGPKFKFPPKCAREIPCKGVCFCNESELCLSAILEMDTSEQCGVIAGSCRQFQKYALRSYKSLPQLSQLSPCMGC